MEHFRAADKAFGDSVQQMIRINRDNKDETALILFATAK
jgi:hypothetical protein